MKINTSYFPSVIILLGVFIFLSLFFGTGNVIPYSKVSNFSSFEGFEQTGAGDGDSTGGGVGESLSNAATTVANTVSDAANTVSTAASNLFGGSSTPDASVVSSPETTVPAAPATPAVEAFGTLSSYSSYH